MRKRLFTLGVVALAAILATSAFAANRGVTFTPVGFIENPGNFPASQIYSMNPEGTIFMATPTPWGNYCVHWTKEEGWGEHVGNAGSVCFLASDGSIMADGYYEGDPYDYDFASHWAGAVDAWNPFPTPDGYEPCGSSHLGVFGASGNGEHATGLTWQGCSYARAFKYEKATDTITDLGSMNGDSSRGNAISDDGSLIGGWTRMLCGGWRGAVYENGSWDWVDGQGSIEPKTCVESGGGCCSDTYCPEYVDDSSCNNAGYCDLTGIACVDGICTGGANAGGTCSGYWNCPGYCSAGSNQGGTCTSDYSCPGTCVGGPNHGGTCTSSSSYYCPDTPVCVENPAWDDSAYKGEVADVSADGRYVLGYEYGMSDDDPYQWASAYIKNPDGSFTQLPPPPGASPYDNWTPLGMSDDGSKAIGRYGWWIYSYPVLWTKETGTLDLQLFLIAQGLDDLWFWYLTSANAISSDGTVIAGAGDSYANPDCPLFYGCTEGWVLDIAKAKVCHKPEGQAERTLTIEWSSIDEHLAHGDILATCEFEASGRRSEFTRPERPEQERENPDAGSVIRTRQEYMQQRSFTKGSDFGSSSLPAAQDETSESLNEVAEKPRPRVDRNERNRRGSRR